MMTAAGSAGAYSASPSGWVLTVLAGATVLGLAAVGRYLVQVASTLADVRREVLPEDKPPISQQVERIADGLDRVRIQGSDRLTDLLSQSRRAERTALAAAVAAFMIGWGAGIGRAIVRQPSRRGRRGRL